MISEKGEGKEEWRKGGKERHTCTVVLARTSLVLLLFQAVSTVKITADAPNFVTFSSNTSDAFRSLFKYIYDQRLLLTVRQRHK